MSPLSVLIILLTALGDPRLGTNFGRENNGFSRGQCSVGRWIKVLFRQDQYSGRKYTIYMNMIEKL